MKSLLILCTGNSCRSQMAEAYARHYFPSDEWKVFSAGIEKHGLNPFMIHVMQEDGLEMSQHHSKTTDELPCYEWDLIITVCDHAAKNCPYLPARAHRHLPFDDPPALSKGLEEEEALPIYRRVRDDIKAQMQQLSAELAPS